MKIKIISLLGFFLTVLLVSVVPGQEDQQNSCVTCHEMLGAPYDSIVALERQDVHGENNITCVDCHGGDPTTMDPEQSMNPSAGYIGKPDRQEIPELCADCHSDAGYMSQFDPGLPVDQLTKYRTSQHGQMLEEGDEKVAECASCHGAHGIKPVDDPRAHVYPLNVPNTCNRCHGDEVYMAEYDIPTDQFEEYSHSVHGGAVLENQDLGAPSCNDCHGNHGATPPGVTSISQVCGTCHVNNQNLFQASKHEPIFDMMDIPECEVCHGNHEVREPTDQMIGTGDESVCLQCHAEGDVGYQMARNMSQAIDTLKSAYNSAEAAIQKAAQKNMSVEELRFNLRTVRQELIRTRTMVHSFDMGQMNEHKAKGLSTAKNIIEQGKELVDEYYFRMTGFGVFTLIITLMAILLYLKIRQIERKQQQEGEEPYS